MAPSLTAALWVCNAHANSSGTPENLSDFFVPRHSATGYVTAINHLAHHLKGIDGTSLDSADIKAATKQKIVLPTDLQEYTNQVKKVRPPKNYIWH